MPTWMLVEDDPDIRNIVSMMFKLWGKTPLVFSHGGAAWAWLDTVATGSFSGEMPELVLMDIRMPIKTGDQVAARIREVDKVAKLPIVLMTAFALNDGEVATLKQRSGADQVIFKPLPDIAKFHTMLADLLTKKT